MWPTCPSTPMISCVVFRKGRLSTIKVLLPKTTTTVSWSKSSVLPEVEMVASARKSGLAERSCRQRSRVKTTSSNRDLQRHLFGKPDLWQHSGSVNSCPSCLQESPISAFLLLSSYWISILINFLKFKKRICQKFIAIDTNLRAWYQSKLILGGCE